MHFISKWHKSPEIYLWERWALGIKLEAYVLLNSLSIELRDLSKKLHYYL